MTVLIPTHDHGTVTFSAIDSVREQTHTDWELFIVADGAPEEALVAIEDYVRDDSRIHVRAFPKGERHGETWRHEVLQDADGEAVCYLSDDDFWLPEHLAHMEQLLREADFAHTRHTEILPDYMLRARDERLDDAAARTLMAGDKYNIFGLSSGGHRMDAYRRLPVGWSPAPKDLWTDLHMWRKFIALDGARFATSTAATTINLARSLRKGQDAASMRREVLFWREIFLDPYARDAMRSLLSPGLSLVSLYDVERRARSMREDAMNRRASEALEAQARALREAQEQHDLAMTAAQEENARVLDAAHEERDRAARDMQRTAVELDASRAKADVIATTNAELHEQLTEIETRRQAAETELTQMRNTVTWRYTTPLRALWGKLRAQLKRLRESSRRPESGLQ